MFRKKAVLFLILLTIVAGLLAACGDAPTSTSAPVRESTTAAATTSAPTTTVAVTTAAPTTAAPTTAAPTTARATTAAPTTVRVTTAPATTPAATTSAPTTFSTINKALPFGIEYVKGYYDVTVPAGLREKLAKDFSALVGNAEVSIYATKSDSWFTEGNHRLSLVKTGWSENSSALKAAGSEKLLGGRSHIQAYTKDGKQILTFILDDFSYFETMQKLGFKNIQSNHTLVIILTGEATNIK